MSIAESSKKSPTSSKTTRRQMITGSVFAFGGFALTVPAARAIFQQTMAHEPSSKANKTRTSIHQEVDFKAAPDRIYKALLDSKQFAAFSGAPAEITPEAGGPFKLFGGAIIGRNVELVPNQRLVQAWRPDDWAPGVYSVVKFDLKPISSGTKIVFDHTGFPEGTFDDLSSGWKSRYWEPLTKFLA